MINPYQAEHYELPSRFPRIKLLPAFLIAALPFNAALTIHGLMTPHPELHLEELPVGYVLIVGPLALNLLQLAVCQWGDRMAKRLAEFITGRKLRP